MQSVQSRREGGFTLLELLLVIGVAALLLIGGISTYRLVSDGNKTTEATRLLLMLRQEAQVLAQSQGGAYTGIAFDSATAAGATGADSPLVIGGVLRASQRNPFNGAIVVSVAANGLQVQFGNIPRSACIKLVQAVNNPSEILSVAGSGAAVTAFPLTLAQATTTCGAAATRNVTWIFP